MDKIEKALNKAFDLHKDQKRKCSQAPYIVHLLDVAKWLLSEPNVPQDVIVAGILHDTLEDTEYTAEQLEKDFGSLVRKLVEFATEPAKDSITSVAEKRQNWRFRKEHTINACKNAFTDELLILLADKLSNMQSLKEDMFLHGDVIWNYFNASQEDIVWYYRSLREVFKDRVGNTRMFQLYEALVDDLFGP